MMTAVPECAGAAWWPGQVSACASLSCLGLAISTMAVVSFNAVDGLEVAGTWSTPVNLGLSRVLFISLGVGLALDVLSRRWPQFAGQ